MSTRVNKAVSIFVKSDNTKDLQVYKTVKCALDVIDDSSLKDFIYVDEQYSPVLHELAKDKHIILYDASKFKLDDIKNDYVCVIKAGNLITKECFGKAIKACIDSKSEAIFFPEVEFLFGYDQEQSIFKYRTENLLQIQLSRLINGEGSFKELLFCRKATLTKLAKNSTTLKNTYVVSRAILEKDVSTQIVPNTVVFARQLPSVDCRKENLLDMKSSSIIYKKLQEILPTMPQKSARRFSGRSLYVKFRDQKIVIFGVKAIKKVVSSSGRRMIKRVPSWLMEDWKHMNYLESSLYPDNMTVEHININEVLPDCSLFKAYYNLTEKLNDCSVKYIFFVPWIVRGGGDKVLINYLKAFKEKRPDWRIAVVSTQPSKNEWAGSLPGNAVFVDFEKETAKFSESNKRVLFSRLIAATQCKYLHIINSACAFDWAVKNAEALKKCNFTVNASSFCYDYVSGTNYQWQVEFADPYLVEGYDLIKHIYTDNKATIEFDAKKNGFDLKKSTVHYQPVTEEYLKPRKGTPRKKIKILWASRIAEQKLPYVLLGIGKKLDWSAVNIDAYGYFYDDLPKSMFNNVKAISYKGQFDGLHSIKIEEYDLFLYTSIIDGVPNILLEAIAAGLPIVASNSGGIKEVIKQGETGLLVEDVMNPDEYIKAIMKLKNNPKLAEKYALKAQELLKKQHSWESFASEVEKDIISVIE